MADDARHPPREAMRLGHEPVERGAAHAARYIGWFGLGIALSIVLAVVLAFGILGGFLLPPAPFSALAGADSPAGAPKPSLQRAPSGDLSAYRRSKEQILQSYGWVDQPAGIVHIPIERAMQLTVQQGRSAAPAASGAQAGPGRERRP